MPFQMQDLKLMLVISVCPKDEAIFVDAVDGDRIVGTAGKTKQEFLTELAGIIRGEDVILCTSRTYPELSAVLYGLCVDHAASLSVLPLPATQSVGLAYSYAKRVANLTVIDGGGMRRSEWTDGVYFFLRDCFERAAQGNLTFSSDSQLHSHPATLLVDFLVKECNADAAAIQRLLWRIGDVSWYVTGKTAKDFSSAIYAISNRIIRDLWVNRKSAELLLANGSFNAIQITGPGQPTRMSHLESFSDVCRSFGIATEEDRARSPLLTRHSLAHGMDPSRVIILYLTDCIRLVTTYWFSVSARGQLDREFLLSDGNVLWESFLDFMKVRTL